MSDPNKDVAPDGAGQSGQKPGKSDQDDRKSVKEKVVSEFKEKFKKPDGSFDVDAAAEEFWKTDERLHYVRKEAKERRERGEQRDKDFEDRERKIKEAENAKLLEEQKYQELIDKQKKEIEVLKEKLGELKRLQGFEREILDTQKTEVEKKLNALGKDARETYEIAAAAMPEDAYKPRLALLEKLSAKTEQQPAASGDQSLAGQPQSGGRVSSAKEDDPEALFALKEKNPTLYRAKIREQMMSGFVKPK